MKILIFGASGSGTTTLGSNLEIQTDFRHLDADDYYWVNTDPPYQKKVPLSARNENIKADFHKHENIVLSGSIVSWGQEWLTKFDLACFIRLENSIRMDRLRKRESERYGEKLLTDSRIWENSKAFLDWANQYENPDFSGRTLKVHNQWIDLLDCKVLRLNGEATITANMQSIFNEIEAFHTGSE